MYPSVRDHFNLTSAVDSSPPLSPWRSQPSSLTRPRALPPVSADGGRAAVPQGGRSVPHGADQLRPARQHGGWRGPLLPRQRLLLRHHGVLRLLARREGPGGGHQEVRPPGDLKGCIGGPRPKHRWSHSSDLSSRSAKKRVSVGSLRSEIVHGYKWYYQSLKTKINSIPTNHRQGVGVGGVFTSSNGFISFWKTQHMEAMENAISRSVVYSRTENLVARTTWRFHFSTLLLLGLLCFLWRRSVLCGGWRLLQNLPIPPFGTNGNNY